MPFTDDDESFKELTGNALTKSLKSNKEETLKLEKDSEVVYAPGQIFYAKVLKCYVSIAKESDDDRVECTVHENKQNLAKKDLTREITLKVAYQGSVLDLKLAITTKFKEVRELIAQAFDGLVGDVCYNDVPRNEAESLAAHEIPDGAELTVKTLAIGEIKRWKRFEGYVKNDYACLNTCGEKERWEGICFVARRDVWFRGFGMFTGYEGKNISFRVKWVIDGEESETHTVVLTASEAEEDSKSHAIDLQ